jgi:phosphoglycerate kinase
LIESVTAFCIGGGMANTFLAALGTNVGKSLRDDDLDPAKKILELAKTKGVVLHLPTDAVVAPSFDADDRARTVPIDAVGDEMILDIGPATAAAYAAVIERAKTIVFNGPMGVYEKPAYQAGTKVVGEAIARATRAGASSVVGGGDAAAAAHALGFADAMTHVSTGGGATLEFLEGKTLPGVAALETKTTA